jgi:hypothetical protein
MDGPGCPGEQMCMVYGCDACSACTADEISVDGQCSSPDLGNGQCPGMPDGGYAEHAFDDECEDYGAGQAIADCGFAETDDPPDAASITACPSGRCAETITGFGERGCFAMEYQALAEEAAMGGAAHPWDAVGATDAFRAMFGVCTGGGDLDSAGPAAASTCEVDPGDACGKPPVPDGPNKTNMADYEDGG